MTTKDTHRAVMQQALDAFEAGTYAAENAAITALRKALAAPQQAQPEQSGQSKREAAMRLLIKSMEAHLSEHRVRADKYREAVESLASERQANARLTAELEALAQPAQHDGTAEHPYNFASYQAGFAEAQAQPAEPLAEGQIEADFEAWLNSDDRKKEAQGKEYPITYLGMDQMARDCMPTPGRPRSELRPSHDNPDPTKTVWHSGCC